ncbi:hypothetical protein AWC38_SpisGene12784 [Stylophora pistillata]|uniref:Uncharacterized protein n=1 Tax=Stylophora pistillata TaxID=50429 RepID=A0A2B4RYJ4_STYPI|nr:hypothetical protein AWC38_SpisGene12784 [Stylophora pistillata]
MPGRRIKSFEVLPPKKITRNDWLTESQVQSFFMRLSALRRRKATVPKDSEQEANDDDDKSLIEDESGYLEHEARGVFCYQHLRHMTCQLISIITQRNVRLAGFDSRKKRLSLSHKNFEDCNNIKSLVMAANVQKGEPVDCIPCAKPR